VLLSKHKYFPVAEHKVVEAPPKIFPLTEHAVLFSKHKYFPVAEHKVVKATTKNLPANRARSAPIEAQIFPGG
jgi:hypothetical protein